MYDVCRTSSPDGDRYAIEAHRGSFLVGGRGQLHRGAGSVFRAHGDIGRERHSTSHAKMRRELFYRERWRGHGGYLLHCDPTRDTHLLRGGQPHWGANYNRIVRDVDDSNYIPPNPDGSSNPLSTTTIYGSRVHKFSVSAQNPDIVWAAITDVPDADPAETSLWRSEDFGNTWTGAHVDKRVRTVHVHQVNDQVLYTNVGVSRDGGKSWENRELQRSEQIQSKDRIYSHPSDPSTIYTCTSKGIHQWTDYLQTRTVIADSLDYSRCHAMLIFPHNPDRVWMGGDTGLWETLNGGQTWSRQNRGLPNVPITALHLTYDRSEILVGTFGWGVFSVEAVEVDARITSVENNSETPDGTALLSNYQNPFTSENTLQFSVEQSSQVRLDVYDVLGRRVSTAVDRIYGSGVHQLRWDGSAMPGGVYFVRMEVNGQDKGVQKVVRR